LAERAILVRPARPDELVACADLYVRVLRETFTWMDPDFHKPETFLEQARSEEIYVAEADGEIAGVLAFWPPQDFIHSLYVTTRGRGVGKAMLDHIAARARGPLSLKVQAPNIRARAFYAREGFRPMEFGRDVSGVDWIRLER
jgi:GNAT superfamily N-acetyltransferase